MDKTMESIESCDLDNVTGGYWVKSGTVIGTGAGALVGAGLASLACGPGAPACMAIGTGLGLFGGAAAGKKAL